MSLHPSHPLETRAREMDRYIIRQAQESSMHSLRCLRARHQRLFHGGENWGDSCWQCRMYERLVYKQLVTVPR